MARAAIALLLALGAFDGGEAGSVTLTKDRPVTKVITLLKDMSEELAKEASEDEEIYETMRCWCETNDKEKTKAITDAEARIASLGTEVEELTAKSSRLNEEISKESAELAANQATLDTATALRTKQLAEFEAEEKSMLGSITSLKSAVTTLESKKSGALVAISDEEKLSLLTTVRTEMIKHKDLLAETLSRKQRRALESFTQEPDDYLDALLQETSAQPQSGAVFGILKQMKETFETNLAGSQKDETENQRAFEGLKAAKAEEIASGTANVETKTQELAVTDQKNAMAKEDSEDTAARLQVDTKFLAGLKEKCIAFDKEYEERVKTRQMETEACAKALGFLTSDDAHDLFSRTLGASFVQVSSQRASREKRKAIAAILRKAAAKAHDPSLTEISVRVRLDKFEKVKVTLTNMVEKLSKEHEEDLAHKETCVDGFNKNQAATEDANGKKEALVSKIDDLSMTLDGLKKAIEGLKASIAETQKQMKYAGEDRELANKDFQLTIADQRATEKLLTAALNVLKGFYEKAALVQQEPPVAFKKRDANKGGGVIYMIQEIINEAKALETEAIYAEEDAQKGYEEFVKDSNDAIEEMGKDLVGKTEAQGVAEKEKVEKEIQRDEVLDTLEALSQENHDLHASCDYIMKNFEVRDEARNEEIEALKQAIAMFGGASFSGFLQSLG